MGITVELFSSPGCSRCGRARQSLRRLCDELGGGRVSWRDVNVLEELDYAVSLGVLATPTICIDGELVFTGLPSQSTLRSELEQRLAANGE
jgi:protein-disulfide isomerase